jgi:DNA-binding CsgD family transcriptional regulator
MTAMPVLVIGSDPAWRARVQRLLAGRPDLDWLGAFAPAEPRTARPGPPALLLLDGDDPLVERARRKPSQPAPRRLYFYRQPDVAALRHCIDVGANACLGKLTPADTVRRAVGAAASGLFVAPVDLVLAAMREARSTPVPRLREPPGDWSGLTGRQREIVAWAARGMSNKQIARQLGISPETVKTHLRHVFEREGVHGRMALLSAHLHDQPAAAAGEEDAAPVRPG